jgi:hypothetical protein
MVDTAAAFLTAGSRRSVASTVSSGVSAPVWYPSTPDRYQIDSSSGPLARRNEVRYTVDPGLEQCGLTTFGTGSRMAHCNLKNMICVTPALPSGRPS